MHVYFSGIGGTGIGPLALLTMQAGHMVSGSDKQDSQYIAYLKKKGVTAIHIGQDQASIDAVHKSTPIDWYVYSSAVVKENADAPELVYVRNNSIRHSKRDEFLSHLLKTHNKSIIAVAGTHGKTTTTAMIIWLFQKLGLPLSYSVGAKTSFCDMGHFDTDSTFFAYECDEFDRNFLSFEPVIAAITGVTWDHHEIYPTQQSYLDAFREFLSQSDYCIGWHDDAQRLGRSFSETLQQQDSRLETVNLLGSYNRQDALLACMAVSRATRVPVEDILPLVSSFPGTQRRFERLVTNLYTDYAHTPEKILGAMSVAKESVATTGQKLVVVYEALTNRRMHYMADQHTHVFDGASQLYWAPSYLAREDPLQHVLSPDELIAIARPNVSARSCKLDDALYETISHHLLAGDLVLCLSGGGGGGLDEWLRSRFLPAKA